MKGQHSLSRLLVHDGAFWRRPRLALGPLGSRLDALVLALLAKAQRAAVQLAREQPAPPRAQSSTRSAREGVRVLSPAPQPHSLGPLVAAGRHGCRHACLGDAPEQLPLSPRHAKLGRGCHQDPDAADEQDDGAHHAACARPGPPAAGGVSGRCCLPPSHTPLGSVPCPARTPQAGERVLHLLVCLVHRGELAEALRARASTRGVHVLPVNHL